MIHSDHIGIGMVVSVEPSRRETQQLLKQAEQGHFQQTHRSHKTNHTNYIQRLARLNKVVLQQLKGHRCHNHKLHQTLYTLKHLNLNQGQVRVDTK